MVCGWDAGGTDSAVASTAPVPAAVAAVLVPDAVVVLSAAAGDEVLVPVAVACPDAAGVPWAAVVATVVVPAGFPGKSNGVISIPPTMITTERTTAKRVLLSIFPSSHHGTGSYPPAWKG